MEIPFKNIFYPRFINKPRYEHKFLVKWASGKNTMLQKPAHFQAEITICLAN